MTEVGGTGGGRTGRSCDGRKEGASRSGDRGSISLFYYRPVGLTGEPMRC